MKIQNKINKVFEKSQRVIRKITTSSTHLTPLRRIRTNKKAVSAVLSNLILIAAVIVVGFAVVAWGQNQAVQYQQTQSRVINDDINQLQERLSFEYISYDGTVLKVNILNSGTNNNINVTSIKVGNNPSLTVNNLYFLNGTQVNGLNVGQDGYFTVDFTPSLDHGTYTIKITTNRGSDFAADFVY